MSGNSTMPTEGPYYNLDPNLANGIIPHIGGLDPDLAHKPIDPYLNDLVQAATSVAALEVLANPIPDAEQDPINKKRAGPDIPNYRAKRQRIPESMSSRDGLNSGDDMTASPAKIPQKAYHSSVALFRDPATLAKKHTRPPMSKLYSSFNLEASAFLSLSDAAKKFMLDSSYPERQECLGVRGKSDSRVVRLELIGYVHQFLEEGAGAVFFPSRHENTNSENQETSVEESPRLYVWPQDRDQIIELCMPLLRRVVRNEQQRQYALTTRKASKESLKESTISKDEQSIAHFDALVPEDVMKLPLHIYIVSSHLDGYQLLRSEVRSLETGTNIMWEAVLSLINDSSSIVSCSVQTAAGLMAVRDDESYMIAVLEVLKSPWLERNVKLIVVVNKDV